MTEQECIDLIQKTEKLDRLLTKQDIGTLTDFKEPEFQDESFKELISGEYMNALLTIVENNMFTKKEGKVIAAFRSVQYLATDKVKEMIAETMASFSEVAVKGLVEIQKIASTKMDEVDFIQHQEQYIKAFNNGIIAIFNFLDYHPTIAKHKNEYLTLSFNILNQVHDINAKRNPGNYMLYTLIMKNLAKVKKKGDFTSEYRRFEGKLEKKSQNLDIRYALGIVLAIIIILLKLLR